MKTVIIFEKPELYFFPSMDNVYSPYGVTFHGFLYWIYRFMHMLHIPGYSLFWGKWKKELNSIEKVIIFDYGYQRGMESYIKKKNPQCEVYLFYWNKIDKYRQQYTYFKYKNNIFSTDKKDCEIYGFKYNHMFYTEKLAELTHSDGNDSVFFVGTDKGRAEILLTIYDFLREKEIKSDIRMFSLTGDETYKDKYKEIITNQSIDYNEYISAVRNSSILLDVNQQGQTAVTMRVVESVFFSKKLITTNKDVCNMPFYKNGNIYVLDVENIYESLAGIEHFIYKPFNEYSKETIEELGYKHWLNEFKGGE